jgi:uncharacterized protein
MLGAVQPKRVPLRTCVACRTTGGKRGLLRVVRLPKTQEEHPLVQAEHPVVQEKHPVVLDKTGKISGRGAYVCASTECVEAALKQKKFERSLRVSVAVTEVATLATQLREAVAETVEVTPQG